MFQRMPVLLIRPLYIINCVHTNTLFVLVLKNEFAAVCHLNTEHERVLFL